MDGGAELLRAHIAAKHDGHQAPLARLAGLPRAQVSQYLSGRRRPGRDNAIAIEQATGGAVPATSWSTRKHTKRLRRTAR